jgi:hypothetical protein
VPESGPAPPTLGTYLTEMWLPAARATIRPTTYSSYAMHVRCYLVPAFGSLRLDQLTAPAINAFYGELGHGWNGRPVLSAATVRRIHATLHRSLRDAVRWQLTAGNAAAASDPPRAARPQSRCGPRPNCATPRPGRRRRALRPVVVLHPDRRASRRSAGLAVVRRRPGGGDGGHTAQPGARGSPLGLRGAQNRAGTTLDRTRPSVGPRPPGALATPL